MPTPCLCALASVLAWASLAACGQERPRALENAQRQRDLLLAGTVDFYHQFTSEARPPRLFTARFGEVEDAVALRGDEAGVYYRADGTIDANWRGPHVLLMRKEDTWTYDSDPLTAMLSLDPLHAEHMWKLRSLGLNSFNSYQDVHDTLWQDAGKQPDARSYSETVENGLHVVRAQTGHGVTTWYIDSQRGWNPVRVTHERDGKIVQESRSTLQNYDGVWFPAAVAFFAGDLDQPKEVVTVASAAFNRPDQARVLTPADIGIEAGAYIDVKKPDGKHEFMMFDGQKPIPIDEFFERAATGEIKRGPNNVRALAEAEAAAAEQEDAPHDARTNAADARSEREAAWEKYTRDFIARYHLDEAQIQKALSILRGCQEDANQYLLRHKSQFDQLREKTKKLAQADSPDSDELRAITSERLKLRQPIGEIFERQLKPRLERLPTRAQRAAAEHDEPPATQP